MLNGNIAKWELPNGNIAKWELPNGNIAKWECQMGNCQMGILPNGNIAKWEYTVFSIGDRISAISLNVIIQFKITHMINATRNQIINQ